MLHAIKTVRTHQLTLFPPSLSPYLGRQTSAVRFREINKISSQPDSAHNMEKAQKNPSEKTGDVMSHSYGEGYATRSDEEGFGGIYGGNQSLPETETETNKFIHENHPGYDKAQGSEVKDGEKARHQTNASA